MSLVKKEKRGPVCYLLTIISIFMLTFASVFAGGVVSHSGSDVKVTYVSSEVDAQTALTGLWNTVNAARAQLATACGYAASLSLAIPSVQPTGGAGTSGHVASQVTVNIGGSVTTVQQAIATLDSAISNLAANCVVVTNTNAPQITFVLASDNSISGTASDADKSGAEVPIHVYVTEDGQSQRGPIAISTSGGSYSASAATLGLTATSCATVAPAAIDIASDGVPATSHTPVLAGNNVFATSAKRSACSTPVAPTPVPDAPSTNVVCGDFKKEGTEACDGTFIQLSNDASYENDQYSYNYGQSYYGCGNYEPVVDSCNAQCSGYDRICISELSSRGQIPEGSSVPATAPVSTAPVVTEPVAQEPAPITSSPDVPPVIEEPGIFTRIGRTVTCWITDDCAVLAE